MKNPFVGLWGNALLLLLNNFVPPFFPQAGWWNKSALGLLPEAIIAPMNANFETGFQIVGELPTEDWAGIGFGISTLLAISVLAALGFRRTARARAETDTLALPRVVWWGVVFGPWLALAAYCVKSGMVTGARLISPYYPLLLTVPLLLPGQIQGVRKRWWRRLALMVMLAAIPVLAVTPGRPLWPAETVLSKLAASHPNNRALARARDVYHVYGVRHDPLAHVRELVPSDLKVIGFMGEGDDIDISFWRPFGSRRVKHVEVADSVEEIRARGIEYIVAGGSNFALEHTTLSNWLAKTGAQVIAETNATVRVSDGQLPWYVVKVPAGGSGEPGK